jgi:hypothetical protein
VVRYVDAQEMHSAFEARIVVSVTLESVPEPVLAVVDATIFVSPDWHGPNFIGYQGLLQRIRFAVDPETNLFYFGRD